MKKTFLVLSALSMIGNHFNMFTMQWITIFIATILSLVIVHEDYIEDNYDIKEWLAFSVEYTSIICCLTILAGYYRMGHVEACLFMGLMHVLMPSLGIVLGETYKMYNPKKTKKWKSYSSRKIPWKKYWLIEYWLRKDDLNIALNLI